MTKKALCLPLSDLHIGKITETYGLDVAARRLGEYAQRVIKKAGRRPDEVWILLLGDMIEGNDIHPRQNALVNLGLKDQIVFCSDLLKKVVAELTRRWFGVPIFIRCVPGNHGRMSKTAHPESNWDLAMYLLLKHKVEKHKYVSMEVNSKDFLKVDILGTKLVLNHKGVPHIGTNARAKKFISWLRMFRADYFLQGHYHRVSYHQDDSGGHLINGCLCGVDSFAQSLGFFNYPSQLLFWIEEGKGVGPVDWITWK